MLEYFRKLSYIISTLLPELFIVSAALGLFGFTIDMAMSAFFSYILYTLLTLMLITMFKPGDAHPSEVYSSRIKVYNRIRQPFTKFELQNAILFFIFGAPIFTYTLVWWVQEFFPGVFTFNLYTFVSILPFFYFGIQKNIEDKAVYSRWAIIAKISLVTYWILLQLFLYLTIGVWAYIFFDLDLSIVIASIFSILILNDILLAYLEYKQPNIIAIGYVYKKYFSYVVAVLLTGVLIGLYLIK